MRWLEEHQGYPVGNATTQALVPAAVIFDLLVGSARVRPSAEYGYLYPGPGEQPVVDFLEPYLRERGFIPFPLESFTTGRSQG